MRRKFRIYGFLAGFNHEEHGSVNDESCWPALLTIVSTGVIALAERYLNQALNSRTLAY